jgi:uracil-DNA glycosylase
MDKKQEDRIQRLEKLKHKLVTLRKSPLYAYRKENNYFPVLGDGSHNAKIVFIGEAPGRKEAETGRPFTGAAGKMLDGLLSSIHLNREDVYITNIVNDRPPENRDPTPEEIRLYSPILLALLEIIQPRVIVTLGRFSMHYVLEKYNAKEKDLPISTLHGKPITVVTPWKKATIVPLYHPAFALYNGSMRNVLMSDFQSVVPFV